MDFRLQAFAPGAMFAGYRVESLIGRGDFRFDRYGHITLAKITIFRVTGI